MAKDMTLFVDDDGAAYQIYASEENSTLHLSRLTDDYLGHAGEWIRLFPHRWHEAPALCKAGGRYWMVTSGCTGWDPNGARLSVADSIWGPWTEVGNPMRDGPGPRAGKVLGLEAWKDLGYPLLGGDPPAYTLGPDLTFGGQSTHLLPVEGMPGAFIAMFDVWRPRDPRTGGYAWLPAFFRGDGMEIEWRGRWDLSVFGR
jgi:hypothetical protein